MTRLIIVDADGSFRSSLCDLACAAEDTEVVAETGDVRESLNLLAAPHSSVLFFGVERLQGEHLSFLRQVVRVAPKTRIILAARSADDRLVVDAFRIGLWGFVKKSAESIPEIMRAIRTVGRGGSFLTPHLTALVLDEFVRVSTRARPVSQAGK